MEEITLEKITYKNYIKVIWGLKVARNQKNFVASNKGSLAEAYVAITNGGVALPFAICRNKKPIGFLMIGYGLAEDDDLAGEDPAFVEIVRKSYCLWRFMIDKRYQRKGYGRKAMQLALDYIKTFPCGKAETIWLSYEPENAVAKKLYESFGFVEQLQFYKGNEGEEIPAILKI
ncbi:MAG: GNAT family N-acetyltransferase [Bacilli bacterium]|nr:GNAT family N-acetyltransferase [Bacilli bacterium]MDY6430379.1 GNAT family N-acetyltransferase [Bacilli bacterium]